MPPDYQISGAGQNTAKRESDVFASVIRLDQVTKALSSDMEVLLSRLASVMRDEPPSVQTNKLAEAERAPSTPLGRELRERIAVLETAHGYLRHALTRLEL